jgi:plastocyanin
MPKTLSAIATVLAITTACGGSKSSPAQPSVTPAATITITSSGVNPRTVTVPRGSQVQFVNNDTTHHDMESDPHPEHTDCPEINSVGFLNPNQSRLTGNLNTARSCGFHDHDMPNTAALHGTIVIQ